MFKKSRLDVIMRLGSQALCKCSKKYEKNCFHLLIFVIFANCFSFSFIEFSLKDVLLCRGYLFRFFGVVQETSGCSQITTIY